MFIKMFNDINWTENFVIILAATRLVSYGPDADEEEDESDTNSSSEEEEEEVEIGSEAIIVNVSIIIYQ